MQTIKLNTNSRTIFDKIMDFIQTIPKNELTVSIENHTHKKSQKKKLTAISLKTKGFTFDREEANER